MTRRRALEVLSLGAAGLLSTFHRTSDGRKPPGRLHLKLSIEAGKRRFIVKEQLRVTVALRNDGSETVSVPEIDDARNLDVEYELSGPSFGAGVRTPYGKPGPRLPGAADTVTLPPGESVDAPIDLGRFIAVWKPGPHTARVRWQSVVSEVLRFDIELPQVASVQIVSDGAESNEGQIRLSMLAADGATYAGFFEQPSALNREPADSSFIAAPGVPAKATSLFMPASNFDRAILRSQVAGWMDANSLGFVAGDKPIGPPLSLDGAQPLRPGLLLRSGDIEVFSFKGQTVSLWQLSPSAAPRAAWTLDLPARPVAGAAAIGRVSLAGPRAAVLVLDDGSGLSVALVQDGRVRVHRVDGLRPLPGSQPALAFAADGRILTSVLVGDRLEPRRLAVLDLAWPAEPAALPPERAPSAQFMLPEPRQLAEACTVYSPRGALPRRDWAALQDDGSVITSRGAGAPKAASWRPVRPLQVAAMDAESYLLIHHPDTILALRRLD